MLCTKCSSFITAHSPSRVSVTPVTLACSHIATTLTSVSLALICPPDPWTFRKQLPGRPLRDLVLSMCRAEHAISIPSTPMSQGRLSSQDLGSHTMSFPSYLHSLAKSCQSVQSTHLCLSCHHWRPATTLSSLDSCSNRLHDLPTLDILQSIHSSDVLFLYFF